MLTKRSGGDLMLAGILAGLTWGIETLILGVALAMTPFFSTEQAVFMAPFVSTFLHDACSAIFACIYNGVRSNLKNVGRALKTRSGKFVILAAAIGGPVGMSGYVMCVANLGASVGAIATAVFPAIGAALAYLFLKEKMQWYRWIFLILTLTGVYGLSYSPEVNIANFWIGVLGSLMCSFGWGIEAVILAKSLQDPEVTDEIALQIRQTTSAVVYGVIVLPILKGWRFTLSLFYGTDWLIPTIALAGLFATISYLFYYKAISKIGASKAMVLNITYVAWAIIFTVIIFQDTSVLNPFTIVCAIVVFVCSILAAADYKDLLKKE